MAIGECVEEGAGKGYSEAVTEFHIVGGLHPTWPFEYYRGFSRRSRNGSRPFTCKAFTMVELDWIARVGGNPSPRRFPRPPTRDAGNGFLAPGWGRRRSSSGGSATSILHRDKISGEEMAGGSLREWSRARGLPPPTATML
jgi:hypothetical protein